MGAGQQGGMGGQQQQMGGGGMPGYQGWTGPYGGASQANVNYANYLAQALPAIFNSGGFQVGASPLQPASSFGLNTPADWGYTGMGGSPMAQPNPTANPGATQYPGSLSNVSPQGINMNLLSRMAMGLA